MYILTKALPYNDNQLEFNVNSGRYELTIEYVKDNFEITFKDDGVLSARIKKNSRKIYNYIYSHSHSLNKEIVEKFINHTEQGRKYLLDCLTEQMEADLESGYNSFSNQPNINHQSSFREEQYKGQVSVDAEQVLDRSANYFGINILYQEPLPAYVFLVARGL